MFVGILNGCQNYYFEYYFQTEDDEDLEIFQRDMKTFPFDEDRDFDDNIPSESLSKVFSNN